MRKGVWVRHNIKRRWEKLGIWNPNWGFAGRRLDASDDFTKWTWRWQPDGAGDGDSPGHYARGLVLRALRLRQNLLRGECAPVMPRSHLEPDALADTAEAFLISRPCFLFQLEVAEEQMRFARLLAPWIKGSYPSSTPREQVIKWWKKRGDWKDEYYGDGVYEKEWNYEFYHSKEHGTVTAWKWRHESPSPEPESLTPLEENRQWDSSIGMAEFMNFAPEEIDELADIDTHLLRPEDPWIKGAYGPPEPLVPGQCRRLPGEDRWKPVEYVWDTRPIPPHDPSLPRLGILDDLRAEQQARIASKEQEESADPEPDAVTPPPPKRRRLRHHQPDDKANEPRPRRSARVTGMKRPAEPLPQEIAPNKRTRTRESARAAAPIVAASSAPPPPRQTRGIKTKLVPTQSQPPPQEHAETQVKRGRGRPRKESMPSARPPTERKKKTPSARPTPARAERTTASGADASGTPRPRGRPRKDGGPGPHPSAKNKASAAPAGTRTATKGTAAGTDVPGVRKRRGRPRKSG
ncbi:hypothetical protein GGS24DRAFT_481950 [Hypoxylon argillaceum]|nr:hypothetical protein GGS24DRAFT_481950 [Hypoxylon argillaceum]